MKVKTYSVTHCPFCRKQISLESPPSNRRYERAEVHIGNGTVLLPEAVVRANHKSGYSDSHAKDLEGYYCNVKCLAAYVERLLDTRSAAKRKAA